MLARKTIDITRCLTQLHQVWVFGGDGATSPVTCISFNTNEVLTLGDCLKPNQAETRQIPYPNGRFSSIAFMDLLFISTSSSLPSFRWTLLSKACKNSRKKNRIIAANYPHGKPAATLYHNVKNPMNVNV